MEQNLNQEAFNQIALTLGKHFDNLYYVDLETTQYSTYVSLKQFKELDTPQEGENFFEMAREIAEKYVHPDDLEDILQTFQKDTMMERLSRNRPFSMDFRLVFGGRIVHMRHIEIVCEDKKHFLCCLENTEDEHRRNLEQERDLESAKRMARRDALTGIRNKNAFEEFAQQVNEDMKITGGAYQFAVVMCDINDLKRINDTRGHSFGDEFIQRASRMICDVFEHSAVFRIGGDEFVVVLKGRDYENRDSLLGNMKSESRANSRSLTGPVVACGMAVYDPDNDQRFSEVFERADKEMYEDKGRLKNEKARGAIFSHNQVGERIPTERKRLLDGMFGALYTIAGEGFVYLNDLRYDYSRWSLPLVDEFKMESEYMYHAGTLWEKHIHPDDLEVYKEAVHAAVSGKGEVLPITYRAKRGDGTYGVYSTRAFILTDCNGCPEYFGGIIIQQ